MTKKLVVTDQAFADTEVEEAAAKAAGAELAAYELEGERQTAEAVQGTHAILNTFSPKPERVMFHMAPVAVIVRYGVGVDNVGLPAAGALGTRACSVPDHGMEEVADHAAAMTSILARKIDRFDQAMHADEWRIAHVVQSLQPLSNSFIGLIGFGPMARVVAKRMQAFGCEVLDCNPLVAPDTIPANSPLRSAPNLFLSPHATFFYDGSVGRIQKLSTDEALRALRGAPLRCQIV